MSGCCTRPSTWSATPWAWPSAGSVAGPPRAVYRLIADATRWPYLFTPFVHVERLTDGGPQERLRLWAVGNGAVRNWTTRRTLDREGLRIRFQQEAPAPPVASMAGEWV